MFYDVFGAIASFLSTYFFICQQRSAWVIGFIATMLNGYLYWQKGIYADMCLESFYALTMAYGWYQWNGLSNITTQQKTPIRILSNHQKIKLLAIISILFLCIYFLLHHFFFSKIAFLDAITCALSLTAQWLMCHKIISTWILWFFTDALYALVYYQKELPAHVMLMVFYMGMAVVGYRSWQVFLKAPAKDKNLLLE